MTLERRSPLPVGRYWVDMFDTPDFDQRAAFSDWLAANVGLVRLITAQRFDSEPPRDWYLFEVTGGHDGKQLPEWVGIGFPTIAGSDVKSSEDTAQVPEPEGPPLLAVAAVLVGAAVLAATVSALLKRGSS